MAVLLWYTSLNICRPQSRLYRRFSKRKQIAVATERELSDASLPSSTPERPRLIFATELDGTAVLAALRARGVLDFLATQGHVVVLDLTQLDDTRVAAARLLNQRGVGVIAGLSLSPEEGFGFNLQNYPLAQACYQSFSAWAREHDLRFEAVGLSIEPPLEDVAPDQRRGPRALLRRVWLARENVLYPAAQAAYNELSVTIHLDGYEVHTYQMPVIADDRRAGTTLIQRALDIIDLPSDLDVLMCSSSVPIDLFGYDLGGALIASYGSNADAIGVGSIGEGDPATDRHAPLPWAALRRDLLLAAQHTDTIYIYSLEDCVERDLLSRIAELDWESPAHPARVGRVLIALIRTVLLALLFAGRFGRATLAWGGWALAIFLWLRGRRSRLLRRQGE
jgi:hypothetical protein